MLHVPALLMDMLHVPVLLMVMLHVHVMDMCQYTQRHSHMAA